jgi:3',5'-cyclic AMP phosphodiesterase CpdA
MIRYVADRAAGAARLLAVSDLHVGFAENRDIVASLRPASAADWLIVAGDVGEFAADIRWALGTLSERFARVIWVPGNHELWTHAREPVKLRGVERYQHLVEICRGLGVLTPEDPYPVWDGDGGPAVIVPLFLLYDYTFRPEGATTKEEGLAIAYSSGVVVTDEALLHPDPFATREDWCLARLAQTEFRLADLPAGVSTVLVNHFPLVREPTRVLRYPQFAQWCGTTRTADWAQRFNAAAVVYGHLHIPRTIWLDGVPHHEVSLGYPREWGRRSVPPVIPRQILPALAG